MGHLGGEGGGARRAVGRLHEAGDRAGRQAGALAEPGPARRGRELLEARMALAGEFVHGLLELDEQGGVAL